MGIRTASLNPQLLSRRAFNQPNGARKRHPPRFEVGCQCSSNGRSGDFDDCLRLSLQDPAGGAHGGGLLRRVIQACPEDHCEFEPDIPRAWRSLQLSGCA